MTVSVLVPFGGTCEWRQRALDWTRARYEELGWEVVVGRGDADEWRKADAVAEALQRARGDVLVVADADCWSCDIAAAVELVEQGTPWVVPFMRVYRLNQRATESVYEGEELSHRLSRARPPYRGVMGGGIVVIDRDLYAQLPLDRRFVGWGGEDDSWGWALRTLIGEPTRLNAHLWHLWHPSLAPTRAGDYGNPDNNALAGRYKDAWQQPDVMRTIVEEARWESNASSSKT